MKNRLKRLTGIIGALLIAVSPCGSQTMAYASEPAETEAAFYDDGADFEIQEDTDEQVQDQEDLDITEEEEDPDTADIQIEEDTEDADSELKFRRFTPLTDCKNRGNRLIDQRIKEIIP